MKLCDHVLNLAFIPCLGSQQQMCISRAGRRTATRDDTHDPVVFKTTTNTHSRTNPTSLCCVFSCLHSPVMIGPLDMRLGFT